MSVLYVRDESGNLVPITTIKGQDGHTPEKGIDYFTENDKDDMVQAVLSALPDYREVKH